MDAMNTKRKTPQAEARSESRIAAVLEGIGSHGSGRLGRLGFAEPARLQNAHLPDAGLWDVFAPLGHGAGRNTQQLGESCGAPSELDCLLRLHGPYLSTLKR